MCGLKPQNSPPSPNIAFAMQHLRPLSLQVGAGIGGVGAGLLMLYFLPIEALNSQLPVELQQLSTLVDAIRNNWEQELPTLVLLSRLLFLLLVELTRVETMISQCLTGTACACQGQ